MSLHLFLGPMFSRKSSSLIDLAEWYEIKKNNCLIIKHSKDTRYTKESKIITHNNRSIDAVSTSNLEEIDNKNIIDKYHCILIDEGQFFHDLIISSKWADCGKTIYISALNADYKRDIFPSIAEIIPKVDHIEYKKAICKSCFNGNASFTQRLTNEKDVELVGGSDKYRPLCRSCYVFQHQ